MDASFAGTREGEFLKNITVRHTDAYSSRVRVRVRVRARAGVRVRVRVRVGVGVKG